MNETELAKDLLVAANQEAATIERRHPARRKVKRDRRKGVNRQVGLEISPSGIALAIVEQNDENETRKLIVERIPFPAESGPACGDWEDGTLRDMLSELAAKHQLAGQAVVVGLGGDPCVTRVVVGENDDVESEVADLTGRTHRYIGMGRGEKVSCETTTRIDAKRKRVWVTVAMRSVVDEIAAAIQAAGMRLAHLEHTMLVLCQILHAYDKDTSEPVLMIVDELGRMDLGISYGGQLLLDYRPAMPDTSVSEGSIVQRHIKCLRRYVWSQMPDLTADLSTIFVTGTESERASLYKSLDEQPSLNSCHFPLEELCEGFEVEGEVSEDPGLIAAIGLARHNEQAGVVGAKNNLMSTLRTADRIPWLPLLRQGWPIAAAVALVAALALSANHSRKIANQTEQRIESLASVRAEDNRVRFTLDRHLRRNKHVETIEQNTIEPRWAQILWRTGTVLPQGVWLDSIHIDHRGLTRIVGASFTDEAIYDYINQLKTAGVYVRVALESTNTTRVGNGPAYRFEISAQVNQAAENRTQTFAKATNRSTTRG